MSAIVWYIIKLMELLQDAREDAQNQTGSSEISNEIVQYLDHKSSLPALTFWSRNASVYPRLAAMATVYLCWECGCREPFQYYWCHFEWEEKCFGTKQVQPNFIYT